MNALARPPRLAAGLRNRVDLGSARARRRRRPIIVSSSQACEQLPSPLGMYSLATPVAGFRCLWARPAEDLWLVGVGAASTLTADTAHPQAGIKEACNTALKGAVADAPPVWGAGPVWMGGFAFDPLVTRDPRWADCPAGMLVLPRFMFTRSCGHNVLTVNLLVCPSDDPDRVVSGAEQELESLGAGWEGSGPEPGRLALRCLDETPYDEWQSRVACGLRAIRAGELTKLVLARSKVLQADDSICAGAVLARLAGEYPGCTLFVIDHGTSCFIGASPEPLVQVKKGRFDVTCLAGTVPAGRTPQEAAFFAEQLRASPKHQREHAEVVSMISGALQHASDDLQWHDDPEVVRLKTVQHLATPFQGSVKPGVDILDLVERLHPTPAVGGTPTDRALEAIRRLEGDRGWYAGPVGWMDGAGEGAFCIGIRSALIRGDQAVLYAGAGIVEGSDPAGEFEETEWKFQPLLNALGTVTNALRE